MMIQDEIKYVVQGIFNDIKAEAVIADLIENGLKPDDFVVLNKGLLKRRYARDIDKVEDTDLENFQKIISFHLNRDGLYDSLPEGLFHQKTRHEEKTGSRFSDDSVKLKKEEKEVRQFFLPFENELFYQRVRLELEERKILSRFSEKIFNDIYPELWNLHRSIDREYVYRMVLLLHMAHKIAGNISLTEKCLESILNEKVQIKKSQHITSRGPQKEKRKVGARNKLGNGNLGIDFICGESVGIYQVKLQFIIGPLQSTKAKDYLEHAPLSQFLKCFYSYFVPVEFEVETKVLVEKGKLNFTLDKDNGPILGYESAI